MGVNFALFVFFVLSLLLILVGHVRGFFLCSPPYITPTTSKQLLSLGNSHFRHAGWYSDSTRRQQRRGGVPFLTSSSELRMGMKITVRIVGRKAAAGGSDGWLEDACKMYQVRLRSSNIDLETTWHKSNDALTKGVEGDRKKGTPVVLLDPNGKQYTSEKLASNLFRLIEEGGSRLVFVIGGAEGLPSELKYPSSKSGSSKAPTLWSLSNLTFTHQFARLLLIEQVYRASEIKKGSGYHK